MSAFPWVDGPYCAVDTETTGIDPFTDRIVEVAVVTVMADGFVADEYHAIVNPGIEIPDEPAAIHGITTERARAEGITTAEAVAAVGERIFKAAFAGLPIVGFNMRFDWPLLISEAERHELEFPAFAPILDPYLIDKMRDKYRKGGRKLIQVCAHYQVELDEADAHGALADAVAAAQVMRAIVAAHPEVGERSLASLFLRQVRGHETWREGFVDYKRRQGDKDFDMPHGWPIPAGPLPAPLEAVVATPAPSEDLPADPPPGKPDDGNEVAASGDSATSEPTPDDRVAAVNVSDVARFSTTVFRKDYDAAPKGNKTKVVDRLRHALVYAITDGRATSLNDLEPRELFGVQTQLRYIAAGDVVYSHDDDGVTFVFPSTGQERDVRWAQLDQVAA